MLGKNTTKLNLEKQEKLEKQATYPFSLKINLG
jgi:hypothetical protein